MNYLQPLKRVALSRALPAALLLTFLLISCRSEERAPEERGPQPLKVKVIKVEEKLVYPSIKAIGNIVQKEKADITSLVSGRVSVLYKDTGDPVRKGDVLALLDQKFSMIALEQAENGHSSARNALRSAQLNYERELRNIEAQFLNMEKLRAELKDRENSITEIEGDIEKKKRLYEAGGITKEELDKLNFQYLTVKKNYFVTRKDLLISEIGYRDSDIVNAGYKLPGEAEEKIELLKEINTRMLRLQIKEAETNLEKAALQLKSARLQYEETFIRSPIDGVVGERYIFLGERVDEKTKLFTIIDSSRVYWRINVTELDAGRILSGNRCDFTIDALGSRKFSGKVAVISPIVDIKSRTVEIRVELANKKGDLRPGMFGRGMVFSDVKQKQIKIPVTALLSYDGEEGVVFIARNGAALKRRVSIGEEDNEEVEVLEGLDHGELLIESPPINLVDKMSIEW